jgi:hypothetical protein
LASSQLLEVAVDHGAAEQGENHFGLGELARVDLEQVVIQNDQVGQLAGLDSMEPVLSSWKLT